METTNIYNITKKIVLWASLLWFIVFLDTSSYLLWGKLSWYLLILIVFIRPLADIFPQIKFLRKIVGMRKEIGIMCATFGLAHGVWFFLNSGEWITGIFNPSYWSLTNEFGWWMLALVISIPLLITSNIYSMKLLKKYWKPLQRFTYLFFIFTAIHIAFVRPSETLATIILVLAWWALRITSYKKYTFDKNKTAIVSILLLIMVGYVSGTFFTYLNDRQMISNNVQESENLSDSNQEDKTTQTAQNTTSSSNEDQGSTVQVASTKKLSVWNGCVWCGKCARIASAYFKMVNHKAQVISQTNTDSQSVQQAISACPVNAITLS